MIIQGEQVKEKLLEGINLVANTVKPTLGPQAKTVILQGNPPVIINDGVTITKYISSDDPYIQMGIQLVQNLASKAQDDSGDGTTTACILAQALCNGMSKYPMKDISTHEFNLILELFKEQVLAHLNNLSEEITDDRILDVATIAANNDPKLGNLIKQALDKVGRDGIITVEESKSHITELILRDGMEIPEGYLSHIMCNTDSGKVVFDNPLVFLSNLSFRNFKDLIPMLEFAASKQQPLVIFCKGMDGSALNNMIMNILNKTVECAVVLAPNFGDYQLDELSDIQSSIGGSVFTQESKDDAKIFSASDFGSCERIVINKETTTLIGGEGDTSDRVQTLKDTVSEMKGHEAARIKSRIARLKGGIATIRVGASSSIEMREKKERLDDALNATKAALSEGIVVGGGNTLLWISNNLNENTPLFLRRALTSPAGALLDNSNMSASDLDDISNSANTLDFGFNALTGEFASLTEAGVYDPVKVTKSSFLAAMSIAQLFYSTDVAVLLEE